MIDLMTMSLNELNEWFWTTSALNGQYYSIWFVYFWWRNQKKQRIIFIRVKKIVKYKQILKVNDQVNPVFWTFPENKSIWKFSKWRRINLLRTILSQWNLRCLNHLRAEFDKKGLISKLRAQHTMLKH